MTAILGIAPKGVWAQGHPHKGYNGSSNGLQLEQIMDFNL